MSRIFVGDLEDGASGGLSTSAAKPMRRSGLALREAGLTGSAGVADSRGATAFLVLERRQAQGPPG